MPELKPCPTIKCAGTGTLCRHPDRHYVKIICDVCGAGTGYIITPAAAIAAWNSLPRALTWTTEPPKVAGWYLRRHNIAGRWSEADVMNFTRLSVKNSIIRSAMIQWAGPIPTPLEPGES